MGKTEAFEYEHIECPQSWVNAILQQYQIFYWDLVGTQTIVSKESHLERGGSGLFDDPDAIYSVTTTERFATIDLRRKRDIPKIDKIKELENRHSQICSSLINIGCSPLGNWGPPPEKGIGCLGLGLYILGIIPGVLYSRKVKKDNEERKLAYQNLRAELDNLLATNRQLLNI